MCSNLTLPYHVDKGCSFEVCRGIVISSLQVHCCSIVGRHRRWPCLVEVLGSAWSGVPGRNGGWSYGWLFPCLSPSKMCLPCVVYGTTGQSWCKPPFISGIFLIMLCETLLFQCLLFHQIIFPLFKKHYMQLKKDPVEEKISWNSYLSRKKYPLEERSSWMKFLERNLVSRK